MTFAATTLDLAEALDELTRFVVRQTAVLREVSFTAVSTLSTLERSGAHRLTELAGREGVSQPSMTAMVSRLERQGYVQRLPDPDDKRIVLVAVTEEGSSMLRRRQGARVAFLATLVAELGADELRSLEQAAPVLRGLTDPAAVPAAVAAAERAATDTYMENK